MKALQVAVGALIVDDQLALIKFGRNHLAGFWGMPGGKIDEGEFLDVGMAREFTEELGQPVKITEYCAIVDEEIVLPQETIRLNMHLCKVEPLTPMQPEPRDLGTEGEIKWIPLDELAHIEGEFVPSDYRMYRELIEGGGRGYFKCRMHIQGGAINLEFFEKVG